MFFLEKDVKDYRKLKKQLKSERYKKIVGVTYLLLSIVFQLLGKEIGMVFSMLSLLMFAELCFFSKEKEMISLYEKALSSDAEAIRFISRNS